MLSAFSSRRAVMLSRCIGISPTWLKLVRTSARIGGGAGLVVGVDLHDAVAARIANEFLYASTRFSFDTAPVITGPGNQPSCLLVVAAAERARTTTSRRARRWARDTVGQRAGEGSADARAILR
jgi:hypothetical protein